MDVKAIWERQNTHEQKLYQGGVYTNTRFTTDAIQYAQCIGLLLTSWDYPRKNGLKDRIDKSGLYPLTALTTLTKAEKSTLLGNGIVLCREINENPSILQQIGIVKQRQKIIVEDSEKLCRTN